MSMAETVHGTCVVFCRHGLLIQGPSGSGKSDLALRLIDAGGVLVADDRTLLTLTGGQIMAAAPNAIEGLIELRGVGLVRMPYAGAVRLDVIVQCIEDVPERLAEPATVPVLGMALPLYRIRPFEASAVAKIRAILQNSSVL